MQQRCFRNRCRKTVRHDRLQVASLADCLFSRNKYETHMCAPLVDNILPSVTTNLIQKTKGCISADHQTSRNIFTRHGVGWVVDLTVGGCGEYYSLGSTQGERGSLDKGGMPCDPIGGATRDVDAGRKCRRCPCA